MIEQFFRPDSVEQALELKRRYQDEAVWFAGGSKLNATPTRTDKKIAISLQDLELDWVDWDNGALRIGAMSRLQPLRDARFIPAALREAPVLFTHAMFVISRPLVVKSPPARKSRCCFPSCWHWMLNWFLATAKRCQSRTTWPAHAIAC